MPKKLTPAEVKKLLSYDPHTGIFRWRVDRLGGNASGNRGIKAGSVAGYLSDTGHQKIGINRQEYLAHRLAFVLMTGRWPKNQVDHRNMKPADNRWSNLREATKAQNMRNRREQRNNTSGVRGVHKLKANGRFYAYIKVDGCRLHLGGYTSLQEASAVRLSAEKKYFGEFAP
jgi:hypothetical protein